MTNKAVVSQKIVLTVDARGANRMLIEFIFFILNTFLTTHTTKISFLISCCSLQMQSVKKKKHNYCRVL